MVAPTCGFGLGVCARGIGEGRKHFFFCKKRSKKTFLIWDWDGDMARALSRKVFCFFFSKKKTFLPARRGQWQNAARASIYGP
ncbi:MAG: hypothetical protein HIU90_05130 [Proteobacteria bacterium]|nr:hypothetical protein [Pseudomonadota bacterium]